MAESKPITEIAFQVVTDIDLIKATLFNRCTLSESGCWVWNKVTRKGYGLFYRDNRYFSAHRISYELHVGPSPEGLHILHSCDNPPCINPNHLRPGTVKENMAEREARKRRNACGEQIGTSKLTANDVIAIRASTDASGVLAKRYGIRPESVWRLRNDPRVWAHLNKV